MSIRSIQPLSAAALAVFRVLTEGLASVGDHRKIHNNEHFMAVSVEVVGTTLQNAPIVSLAHYYEQNGDLMADPEVTFVVAGDDYVFPISYRQDGVGINREYVRWEDGKVYWNLPMQNDLASFCNTWMHNIQDQQYGGKLPQQSPRSPAGAPA